MDHIELSKRLRDLSKKGSTYRRTICKMAAQKIDNLAAELEGTKALLAQALADLKEADVNCAYCAHKWPPAPCAHDEEYYTCDQCPHECYCKDCDDNDKWRWRGMPKEDK